MDYIKYNMDQIDDAMSYLGKVKLYKFPKEIKQRFFDAYRTLLSIVEGKEDDGVTVEIDYKCDICGTKY